MKKLFIFGLAVAMLSACGNDPVTNAGYFDDDLDRSNDSSYHDDHSDRSTTIDDHSDRSTTVDNHSVISNHYYPDTLVVIDTIVHTITDTVIQRVHDTLNINTLEIDTVITVDTVKTVVRDTVKTIKRDTVEKIKTVHDTIATTIYDTVKTVRFDTIIETKTVRDTVRLLARDTVSVPVMDYYDSLQNLYDNLPYYRKNVTLGNYNVNYTGGGTDNYSLITIQLNDNAPTPVDVSGEAYKLHYISLSDWGHNTQKACRSSAYSETQGTSWIYNTNTCNIARDAKYFVEYNKVYRPYFGYYVENAETEYTSATNPTGCIMITMLERCVKFDPEKLKNRYSANNCLEYSVEWEGVVRLCAN